MKQQRKNRFKLLSTSLVLALFFNILQPVLALEYAEYTEPSEMEIIEYEEVQEITFEVEELLEIELVEYEEHQEDNLITEELQTEEIPEVEPVELEESQVEVFESEINETSTQVSLIDIFADEFVMIAVAEELNINIDDNIDISVLATIMELDVFGDLMAGLRVENLSGMEYLTGLRRLNFAGSTNISDITPLANLTNLTWLNLSLSNLSDISPLANLINLEHLDLTRNNISDLTPLANLINLRFLDLNWNSIVDVSPLESLTELRRLYISVNQISDVSPLANLMNLESFTLNENYISDISPLNNIIFGANWHRNVFIDRQTINLNPIDLGYNTKVNIFLPDGTDIELSSENDFSFENQILTWYTTGNHTANWSHSISYDHHTGYGSTNFRFSGTIHQTVIGDDNQGEDDNQVRLIDIFQDINLAKAIANELNVNVEDNISLTDLETITVLEAPNAGIYRLDGITYLTNLEFLDVVGNHIRDVRPLANMSIITGGGFYADVRGQIIQLEPTTVGTGTALNIFLPDGSTISNTPEDADLNFSVIDGVMTWYTVGEHSQSFVGIRGWIDFTGIIYQTVTDVIDDDTGTDGNDNGDSGTGGNENDGSDSNGNDNGATDNNGTDENNGDTGTGNNNNNNNNNGTGNEDNGTNDDTDTGNNNNNNRPQLPQTGAIASNLTLVGITLANIGGVTAFIKHKKK